MGRETGSWQFCPRELAGVEKEGGGEGRKIQEEKRKRWGWREHERPAFRPFAWKHHDEHSSERCLCKSCFSPPCNTKKEKSRNQMLEMGWKFGYKGTLSFSKSVKILWAHYNAARTEACVLRCDPTLCSCRTQGENTGLDSTRTSVIYILLTRWRRQWMVYLGMAWGVWTRLTPKLVMGSFPKTSISRCLSPYTISELSIGWTT